MKIVILCVLIALTQAAGGAACVDACAPLTCDEVRCHSSDCPSWSNDNYKNGDAPATKTRPSLCDVGADVWYKYPFEHNCGCKVAHANGCNQCREGFWQFDKSSPCLCNSVIPNCVHGHDGRGCDVCATGYNTVSCPLWRGYTGDKRISVCSSNTNGTEPTSNKPIPDPTCDEYYDSYEITCASGAGNAPCFDNSWPVAGTRKRTEFEDCTDDSTTCATGLTCVAVNYWYKQCQGTNKDCPAADVTLSPPGLANESPSSITLSVWYTRAGSCSKVSCGQAGSYSGTVDICCGADGSTSFEAWTSGGNCEIEVQCAGNNVTFTDGSGTSRRVAGWYAKAGRELQIPCPDGLQGSVVVECPNDSSVNPVGTLVYKSDSCRAACFAGGDCTTTADCCGDLECTSFGTGAANICTTPLPTCTLGDTSGVANIGDTSGCTGTIRDDECSIGCAAGHVALGCPQCLKNGGEFSFRNFKCVPETSAGSGIPSRPTCECNTYSASENYKRSNIACQGPAHDIGVGRTDENNNQNFTEHQVCFDRPGATQLLDEGTDQERSSGRCGDASGIEIHWGKGGLCQLSWECELPVTCATQQRVGGGNFWDNAQCASQFGNDNTWIAKANQNANGCGMNEADCNKHLCCEQVTCADFFNGNYCATGTYPVSADRGCANGNCDEAQCCGRKCDGITCDTLGLTNPDGFKNYACFDNVDTADPDHCQNRCCVATCASATAQPGFCDSPFTGMSANTKPEIQNRICSHDSYQSCDPLTCCSYAKCSDVFQGDSTFCTAAGLTNNAFEYAPCGATTGDCTTEHCCRATCGDFCSHNEGARRGNGDNTAQCFWPSDPDLTNSTFTRNTPLQCRNENVECGLIVANCSQSLCCQMYYPEFPSNEGGAEDSTYKGHGNEPYTPKQTTCCSESSPFDQSDVTCTQGRITKSGACGTVCTDKGCDESTCCADTCSTWLNDNACNAGSIDKTNIANLLCSSGPGGACGNSYCCDDTCATWLFGGNDCGADGTPKAEIELLMCSDNGSCDLGYCCEIQTPGAAAAAGGAGGSGAGGSGAGGSGARRL